MTIPLFQVDAFTAEPFRGNPAGVCILQRPAQDTWMQAVAAEMNLSETAFVCPTSGAWDLRWFTPTTEVRLCGHATLASAHVLWEAGRLRPDEPARFDTLSGRLTCAKRGDWIEMDFPADRPVPAAAPSGLTEALAVQPVAVAQVMGAFAGCWLLELVDEQAVRAVAPDFKRMVASRCGAIVTARADTPGFDFVSRFFAPAEGIDEDPVTGSAHCSLTPYWAGRLGKSDLVGLQVSRRTGVVRVSLAGNRVKISGQAVTIFRAELSA
ncbi:MAG: PhzF family phenazine biosynthesis protein [Phycisphaerae bacterium]|nr:PhzF family phenazine biosynthesis protein [Phycisphaerae bacterium]